MNQKKHFELLGFRNQSLSLQKDGSTFIERRISSVQANLQVGFINEQQ